jgi:mono/diheme cytochrome c family protein
MTTGLRIGGIIFVVSLALPLVHGADEPTAAERGQNALQTRHFTPPTFSINSYQTVWRLWDNAPKEKPASYAEAFRDYYGMHPAPYPNNGLPMGLREAPNLFGRKALSSDCMLCHGGSIFGQSYVGLPNTSLDMQALFADLTGADGLGRKTPFPFTFVRGTTEAGSMAVWLLEMREPDLKIRSPRLNLDLRPNLCEDPPAWWLLHKKQTMYHTGSADTRSVRSIMQFMMSPLNGASAFHRDEATFADIREFLLSLRPPKYPLPIDRGLAEKGERLFVQNCARCHGTYGENWTYPNKIVPLADIGTDPTRFNGVSEEFGRYYNQSWFAQEKSGWLVDGYPARPTKGYQAPPLDGIWATAPYFHNGSAPTVADVLNSKSRPKVFTRSYRTGKEDYDPDKLGWKVQILDRGADPKMSDIERRKIYDTTLPGRGNGGHTFGDHLSDSERRAVIEYLKTL